MKQVLPGIWTWSVFNPEKQLNFNGWYIQKGLEAVVIDPPSPGEAVLAEIRKLGRPKAVLLTNKHHTRAAEVFRREFDAGVLVHENDKKLMEIPINQTFRDGDALPCDLKAITISDSKTPGETAFYFRSTPGIVIVGDAVIGKPAGNLTMLPDAKFSDPKKAREGLRRLLTLDFEALLLGDGESIPTGGKSALERFLSTP